MNKNTMIYKVAKHIALFMAAIFVAMVIDGNLHKSGIHPFGGLIAGLLIGVFIENHRILYGVLCGFIYTALILTIYIIMGLDKKLSLGLLLGNVFILKELMNITSFILGAWLGGPVKKRIQIMNKNTFIYKAFKYLLLFFAAIVVTGVIDQVLMKFEIPKFGGIVGGLLLGIFLNNPSVLYGVLCGILNVMPATAYKVIAGLLSGLPISDAFANIVGWRVILTHLFIYIFLFSLGIRLGIIVKNKIREMKSVQKSDEQKAISTRTEQRKEKLKIIVDYFLLYISVIVITTILDIYAQRHSIVPLSQFLGGMILAAFMKKPRIRYGLLCGILYILFMPAVSMTMFAIKEKMLSGFILKAMFVGFYWDNISNLLMTLVLFSLGVWFVGEVKKKIKDMRVTDDCELEEIQEIGLAHKKIIKKAAGYLMLFGTVGVVAGLTGSLMMKLGIPMIGELIGGFLLAMFLDNPRAIYGALFGLIYEAIFYLLSIISGIDNAADTLFIILCVPAIFALGTWFGIIVKKRMQKDKETELANS